MSTVADCLNDLVANVQSIAVLANTTEIVFTPDELVKLMKGTPDAAVGVVYGGMQAIGEVGHTAKGLGNTVTFQLYLSMDASPVSFEGDSQTLTLLQALRSTLLVKRAPGGHYWEFLSEAYADAMPGRTLWVQTWATKLMRPG